MRLCRIWGLRFIIVLLFLLLHQLMHASERAFEGQPDELAAFSYTRPGEQTLQYVLDGTLRDAHALGDVPIRETAKDAQERSLLAVFQCAAGLAMSLIACTSRSGASDFRKIPEAPNFKALAERSASVVPATIKNRP